VYSTIPPRGTAALFYFDHKHERVGFRDSRSDVWTSTRQTPSHNSRLHKAIEKDKVLGLHLKKSKSSFLCSRVRNGNSLKDSLCYGIEPPRADPFQTGTAYSYFIRWLRDLGWHRVLKAVSEFKTFHAECQLLP